MTDFLEVHWTKSGRRARGVALAVGILVIVAAGAYHAGREAMRAEDMVTPRPLPDEVRSELEDLRDEHDAMTARLRIALREAGVERESGMLLQRQLVEQRNELQDLREELAFYRSIVSPGEEPAGLRIRSFHLEPGEALGSARYELVLAQGRPDGKIAEGAVELLLQRGQEEGEALDTVATPLGSSVVTPYRFRYFQRIEGVIHLPVDAGPGLFVKVMVTPSGALHSTAEQTLAWPLEAAR